MTVSSVVGAPSPTGGEVGFEVSPRRPLALMIVGAFSGRHPRSARRTSRSYAPPRRAAVGPTDGTGETRTAVEAQCTRILRGLLLGERLDELANDLAPDVVVWCPTMYATSRGLVLEALEIESAAGDTMTEVSLSVANFDYVAPHGYLEWRLTGRFTNPCFVDDDLLVEPNGRLLETAGAMVITLASGRAVEVHCYHDDLALLEQMMAAQ